MSLSQHERLRSLTPCSWGTKAYYAIAVDETWMVIRCPVLAWALVEAKVNSIPTSHEEAEYAPFDPRTEEHVRPLVLSEGQPEWMESDEGLVHIRIPGDQSQDKDDELAIEVAQFHAEHGMLITSRASISIYGSIIYEHPAGKESDG
jgi:hypothetical protein